MSKRKNLLNERTVRRFMKLANVELLTENFFDPDELTEDDEEEEADFGAPELGPEVPEVPEDPEALEPAPEGGTDEASVREFIGVVVDAIADKYPEVGEITVDGEPAGEAPPEEEPELELGDLEAPPEEEVGGVPPEVGGEEAPAGVYEEEVDDDLAAANVQLEEEEPDKMSAFVNEISKRVARRLLRAAAKRKNSQS